MDEVHRNEKQHPVMAMPVKQKGIRKSTRKGAGKRKVNFGDTSNDQWQQLADIASVPSPVGDAVQPTTVPQTPVPAVRRSAVKLTVRRKERTSEEVEEDREAALDLSRMPRSYPTEQSGQPTPGTTNLHKPPQGAAKAPNLGGQDKEVIDLQDDDEPPDFPRLKRFQHWRRSWGPCLNNSP